MTEPPGGRRARKPPKLTEGLQKARAESAAVLHAAWGKASINAKTGKKNRPTATDIAAARTSLGLPSKGTSTH